jgi:hypothetical protein
LTLFNFITFFILWYLDSPTILTANIRDIPSKIFSSITEKFLIALCLMLCQLINQYFLSNDKCFRRSAQKSFWWKCIENFLISSNNIRPTFLSLQLTFFAKKSFLKENLIILVGCFWHFKEGKKSLILKLFERKK